MITFLRFVGVTNAAIWFGATFFFTFVAGTAFFSKEMTHYIQPPYNGLAAEIVIGRLFVLHHVCGTMALLHLVAEWLYASRLLRRATLALLIGLVGLNLYGGWVLQPRLKQLHLVKYAMQSTPVEVEAAKVSFRAWHRVSMVANLFVLAGALAYLWQVVSAAPPASASFISGPKFGIDKRA